MRATKLIVVLAVALMSLPGLAWAALTTTALRGTERAAGGAIALPEPLAALCKSDADAEAQLLRAIALLAPVLRAGQVPNKSNAPLPPEETPDTQPQAGPLASHALTVILGAEHTDLLREWCQTARAALRARPSCFRRVGAVRGTRCASRR